MESPLTAKAALLQALAHGSGFGLDLIQRVQQLTGGKLTLGQGSVYPALKDLEWDGLAESYDGAPTPERGGRPRRYFKLTPRGFQLAREHRAIAAELFGLVPAEALTKPAPPTPPPDTSATTFWILVQAIQHMMKRTPKAPKKGRG